MPFLDLPYDVRHQIYAHLFPHTRHLYLHALEAGSMYLPSLGCAVPVGLLRTCKALHQEGSEYLYNGYLFDIVGQKLDCLERYERIRATVEKYARDEVHVRAFSNGLDSSTGCISILVGDVKLAMLEKRQRGQPATFEQLRGEEKTKQDMQTWFRAQRQRMRRHEVLQVTAGVVGGVLVLLLAWGLGILLL